MSTRTGSVTNVTSQQLGSVVVSWTGTALVVAEAADFPEAGQFTWNDQVYDYTSLDSGNPDPYDTLTTVQAAPDGVAQDDPILIYPMAYECRADVLFPEDSEPVPCVVPHALQPLVLDGVRDDPDAESVEVEQVNGVWYVRNVVGQQAPYDAETIAQLRADLDTEQQTRDTALKTLNDSLVTEAQTRATALQAAADALTAEQKARADADTTLNQTIATRPVVTSSAAAPASPNSGDTWFKLDANGNVLGVQTWNGTSWVPQALTGSALLAGSITTGNLAAGAVTASTIAAGAITADKLTIGSTDNLIRDGELVDPVLAHSWSGIPATASRVVDTVRGPVLRFTTGTAGAFAVQNQTFTVVAGDEIYYQFRAWQDGTHASGNRVGLAIYATKADGSTSYTLGTVAETPTGGLYSGVVKVTDATWRTVQFRAYCQVATAASETFDIAQMFARRRYSGQLLVDGSITATQIAASAITSDKISAGAVTTTQLAANSVTATQIKAGAVGADQIAANAITADKLSANAVTAASIKAGAIDGMTIQGADIYSPDSTSTPRIHLGGSVFEIIRSDGENTYTSASLGGSTADSLQLMTADGHVLAGFDPTGAGTMQSLAVNGDAQVAGNLDAQTMSLNGTDLGDTLAALPVGVIARQVLGTTAVGNGVKFGSSWLGFYELFYSAPGHTVRVVYESLVQFSAAGTYNFRMISTANPDPTAVPVSPKADASTGSVLAQVTLQAPSAGYYALRIAGWTPAYVGSQRVLIAANTPTSGAWGTFYTADSALGQFYAEDMGTYTGTNDGGYNRGGGSVYSGSTAPTETAPTATKKTYTSIWNAAWVKSWRDGSAVTDYLQQGNYGGAQRYSMVGFTGNNAVSGETGKSITAALSGASVSKVEVYLVNKSWYSNSGGEAIIGHHGNNSAPSSAQTSGGGAFATDTWATGAGQWVTLPSSWYPYFASGNYDGITLGEGAGTNLTYYGKFSNALKDCRLRITYTR